MKIKSMYSFGENSKGGNLLKRRIRNFCSFKSTNFRLPLMMEIKSERFGIENPLDCKLVFCI